MDLYTKPCKAYTDDEFIQMIRGDARACERAVSCLHELYFNLVLIAINSHKLDRHEVLTAYNKAIIQLKNCLGREGFMLQKSISKLFKTIFKRRCLDIMRQHTTSSVDDPLDENTEPKTDTHKVDPTLVDCLEKAFSQANLPSHCWEMFMERMIDNISPEELAQLYGYKDGHVFSAAFYELKKRLKKAMQNLCENDHNCKILCSRNN